MLAVRVTVAAHSLLVLTAHAPHTANTAETIQNWWTQLHGLLKRLHKDGDLIILGLDANAQVGSVPDDSIGEHAPDTENLAGSLMREMANELSLGPRHFCWQ